MFKKGGDVAPLPEGLLTLAFHVSSMTSNGLFVDVDTAAGLFMDELTSVEVSITRDGMTAQTYLLTTVTEVETGIRRFQDHFTVASGTKLYEAGETQPRLLHLVVLCRPCRDPRRNCHSQGS